MHEKNLARLISAASDKPRRKRLHALRLALKTIRYQMEWLPGRPRPNQALVKRIKQVQAVLGRYEELADFRRWRKYLDLTVRARFRRIGYGLAHESGRLRRSSRGLWTRWHPATSGLEWIRKQLYWVGRASALSEALVVIR